MVNNQGWEKIWGARVRIGEGVITSALGSGWGDPQTPQRGAAPASRCAMPLPSDA